MSREGRESGDEREILAGREWGESGDQREIRAGREWGKKRDLRDSGLLEKRSREIRDGFFSTRPVYPQRRGLSPWVCAVRAGCVCVPMGHSAKGERS